MFTLVTILKVKKTNASYLPSAVCPPAFCFSVLTVSTAAGKQSGDVTAVLSGRCAHSQCREAERRGQTAVVPTFVSFLREVESPYEVHDYVRAYLGDTPEAKDFSKQFLERRNKQKTVQQKPPQVTHDSGWALYQTSQSNSQQTTLETAQSAGRKKKKQKMVRADPSLLGFSVNASSERLNMGEIETLEDY
ncbi:unnamed protein product [Ranitomeya imitator]|uniref:Uncharacterized protein n=1 Tax=Ranitomeya imitator TaxID=111125 RepID=A0ABN9M6M7_9NEOB|nr:unnamed protein product [Ranitomeya imitator]